MEAWIEEVLSQEQIEPFRRDSRNACILAAAGSGKTRTLVHLLAQDLADGTPAEGIVAFTFTEKAADELLARIHLLAKTRLSGTSLNGLYVGTIHAWCLQYLYGQPDFYNFVPLDELHVDALVSRLYDALELERAYGLPYPRGISKFLVDLEVYYNERLPLEQVPAGIRESVSKFLEVLRSNRLVTFGGMVAWAIDHLEANGPVKGLQSLYVDEYQDVNPAQVALIRAMLPADGKLVVVGDDLQCIYQWRGSDVRRILNFAGEFADSSVHRLSTNYRARPGLVDVGNAIAEHVSLRDVEKVMLHGRPTANCELVHWLSLDSEQSQANAVADIVGRFVAEGVPTNRIAVLLRSVLGSGQTIVETLERRGFDVQCPILSRGGAFINEFLLPVLDWLRVEHHAPRSRAEEERQELAADALWGSVARWVNAPEGEDAFWDGLNHWLRLVDEKKNEAYDVRGRLYDFMDTCGVRLSPADNNLLVGTGIASQIIRSVEEIHRRRIAGQQRRTPRGVLTEVFFALVRNQGNFGESVPIDTHAEGVLVTTVHQAKGLEWPIVILPMLASRRFPVGSRGHDSSFPAEIAGRYGTSVEDEWRLFYVAATRARERLFLLDHVYPRDHARSVFLHELRSKSVVDVRSMAEIDERVWHIDPEDLVGGDAAPVRIGLSDLLLYVECPYQFGLRRVVAVQPSVGDELGFGQGLHELIQRRFDEGKPWTPKKLKEQVEEHVKLPYMSEGGEEQSRRAIEDRIEGLEEIGAFTAEVEPELDVEVLIGSGLVHGIIDCLQTQEDGSVRVRDWKSNVHDGLLARYERQLRFYAHAVRQQGRRVSGADLVDVAASCKAKRLVTVDVEVTDGLVHELVSTLEGALVGISAGQFPAVPSAGACSSCDMRRICGERYGDGSGH